MLLGELHTGFPWGVLLVTDDDSTEPIPEWAGAEQSVTNVETALVLRVLHQDEGEVTVRVWQEEADPVGGVAFHGTLKLPSGVLRVSDALGDRTLRFELSPGAHEFTIYTDSHTEAREVHIAIDTSEPLAR